MPYKVIVIGAGPGGYVSAIRLSQLGLKTAIVEKHELGGECTNYGCIPTKSFIEFANTYWNTKKGMEIGVIADSKIDFPTFKLWKEKNILRLRNGIQYLCKENGVEIINGEAYIKSPTQVTVKSGDQTTTLDTENIIVATGSTTTQLPSLPFDGKYIISSKNMFEIDQLPKSILIVGGGVIGIEFAAALAKLGTQVTIVEVMDQILPGFDAEIVRYENRFLSRLGIKIYTKATVSGFKIADGTVESIIKKADGETVLNVEKMLVAVGRKPYSNIGLKEIGVILDAKGHVIVDNQMKTNIPNVYAIGDVVGTPYLAHKAFRQGLVAAEVIGGHPIVYNNNAVPNVVFSEPEIAFVGLTEEEAKNGGHEISVGRFPLTASARALTERAAEGFVKIIIEKNSHKIVGAQMIGAEASELVSELALAIESGLRAEDIAGTVHPHPTISEVLMDAAEDVLDRPIHTLKKK